MKYFVMLIYLTMAWPALAQNPVAYSDESVAAGAQLFQQYCTACHGADGRAQIDVISDATDLTEPDAYYSGTSQQDIFNSIRDGSGVAMPPWNTQIPDEADSWRLVNFIRSLWTQQQRDTN